MKFPTSLVLTSDRCRLRYISRGDIPHIYAAAQYPGFTDGMMWEPPEAEEDLIPFHESNEKAWAEDSAYTFSIEHEQSGDFIGRISIRKQAEPQLWDLGFWTHPRHQEQGYMSEAVGRLLAFGFQQIGAQRIIATCAKWNKASRRVMEKNGMKFIRHTANEYEKNGQWISTDLLAITRSEWQQLQFLSGR